MKRSLTDRFAFLAFFAATTALGVQAPGTAAAVSEKRTYTVSIDNHPAGTYVLKFDSNAGQVDVTSDCQINHKVLIFKYHYRYHGHEVWKDNRLASLTSDSDDNGTRCTVNAQAQDRGLKLKVNGKDSAVNGETFASSYWHLLPQPLEAKQFLEVDTGRIFTAKQKLIGKEQIPVGGVATTCQHYQISGGDDCDVWYDGDGKLVRQTSQDGMHKSAIQLLSIERQ